MRATRLKEAIGGLLLVLLLIWAANFFLVGRPVSSALDSDSRNETFKLVAHYRYYVDPSTLVLDLRSVEGAAPVDLFRGFFQSALAMHESGRGFTRVILSRSRSAVFVIEGDEFGRIGAEYAAGQNIVYLIRTLPEKLYSPDGTPAFGTWTGGLLGASLRQMQDVGDAGRRWAEPR